MNPPEHPPGSPLGKALSPDVRACVLIPSYNSGPLLEKTVTGVLEHWPEVIVILDGSDDGSGDFLAAPARELAGLHVVRRRTNGGKGAAVLSGLELAEQLGMTHAAVFDADGQHDAGDLPRFMEASRNHPEAMILGLPLFGPDAPSVRLRGRKIGNWWTNLSTLWGGIGDSLFGFRIYPLARSLRILRGIGDGKGFDFDTQLAIRLYWEGVPPLNIPTRVRYLTRESGGVTHFRYLRDNILLVRVHTGFFFRSLLLWPRLIRFRRRGPIPSP